MGQIFVAPGGMPYGHAAKIYGAVLDKRPTGTREHPAYRIKDSRAKSSASPRLRPP